MQPHSASGASHADTDSPHRESLRIGDDVEVTVMAVNGSQVRIGIKAPRHVAVDREEIAERKQREREHPLPELSSYGRRRVP